MPSLWSPEELANRFSPYIEELHDVFIMHGLHYGAPEDILVLAARLEKPSLLSEELGAIVRSVVLREGGTMPRTDLLEILAIAIAGPQMNPAGEELQKPVRQMLAFLHNALKRPWNEPPGARSMANEEHEAYEEHRGRNRVEQKPVTVREEEVPVLEGPRDDASSARANVIPFGRARAVFSRLVRMDGSLEEGRPGEMSAELSSYEPGHEGFVGLPKDLTAPAAPNHERYDSRTDEGGSLIAQDSGLVEADRRVSETPETLDLVGTESGKLLETASRGAKIAEEIQPAAEVPVAAAIVAPIEKNELPTAAAIPVGSERPGSVEASSAAAAPASEVAEKQILPDTAASILTLTKKTAVTPENVEDSSIKTVPTRSTAAPSERPRPGITLEDFDAEPPMPSKVEPQRTALWVAAAVLVAAIALGAGLHAHDASRADVAHASIANPVTTPLAETPKPEAGTSGAAAIAVKDPTDAANEKDDSHSFDDGYIAAPYSNVPSEGSGRSAAQNVTAPADTHTEIASVQPPKVLPVVETRAYRDPDTMIAGDLPPRDQPYVVMPQSIHPSVAGKVMAQNLISAPKPDYPALAKITHLDGPVVLEAEINRNGHVADTRVLSGHRLLRHAAEEAVRQWRYRPYLVDGRPVPVTTTITVHFDQER